MITLIEARNYRCLRSVRQTLGPFQLLVGPNGTGKSTLLDVVRFLSQLTTDGLQAAISERTSNIYDLFWQRSGAGFELALEAAIPDENKSPLRPNFSVFRYEIAIGIDPLTGVSGIREERGFLVDWDPRSSQESLDAGDSGNASLITSAFREEEPGKHPVLVKQTAAAQHRESPETATSDSFFAETEELGFLPFRFGTQKSALANLPEDNIAFPAASWFRNLLTSRVIPYELDAKQLRKPSPPAQPKALQPDAANLPWVIADFRASEPAVYRDWIAHLQIALPDLRAVDTVLREEDRHCYLMLEYQDGLHVPSWNVSEGTLRLIALTLPAYLRHWDGSLLIEEPENGLHPLAIETAYQSLSSVYSAQVLMATHSPLLVGLAKPSEVLCFTKDKFGAAQIVSGDHHPRLADWHGEVDLGTLFASGVLG